jgi:hypothetical protein
MRKKMFIALVTILFSGSMAASASAQMMVCWELQQPGLVGIQPFVYKLSVLDMGNGNYSLVGSSYTTPVIPNPTTTRRMITGAAVLMEANKIEVSLSTKDFGDGQSLDVSDVHMVLDGTLNGTFHIVNVHYPVSSDTESSIVTTSGEGNVSLVGCN